MTMLRRVFLLALVAVSGIAILAPLSARSAAQLPDVRAEQLLARQPAPRADALRGGLLTARGSSAEAAATTGAEAIAQPRSDAPPTVTMQATIVVIPTAAPPPPALPAVSYSGNDVWADLAQCESGGNWAINTGNGYYGGLQFSLGTWNGYGGAEFAEYPHQATPEEQIIVAERLRAARGYQPWPACRAKLGLP
jgi:hypothetical protein